MGSTGLGMWPVAWTQSPFRFRVSTAVPFFIFGTFFCSFSPFLLLVLLLSPPLFLEQQQLPAFCSRLAHEAEELATHTGRRGHHRGPQRDGLTIMLITIPGDPPGGSDQLLPHWVRARSCGREERRRRCERNPLQ